MSGSVFTMMRLIVIIYKGTSRVVPDRKTFADDYDDEQVEVRPLGDDESQCILRSM
jgi:hypothetical protein